MYGAHQIPMSLEEYHRLPRKLGWMYDYESGRAIIGPADVFVNVRRSLAKPLPAGAASPLGGLRLCRIETEQAFALEALFFEAFRPTAETVGLEEEDVRAEATFSMILYASGALGAPLTCSRVLVDGQEPVAALLVVDSEAGPRIQLLMVHPRFQRRGLATVLFGEACAALARHGVREIRSRYLLANEPARRWCRKVGFEERPERAAVEHHRHFYHYERARLQGSAPAEVRRIERELRRWEALAENS